MPIIVSSTETKPGIKRSLDDCAILHTFEIIIDKSILILNHGLKLRAWVDKISDDDLIKMIKFCEENKSQLHEHYLTYYSTTNIVIKSFIKSKKQNRQKKLLKEFEKYYDSRCEYYRRDLESVFNRGEEWELPCKFYKSVVEEWEAVAN